MPIDRSAKTSLDTNLNNGNTSDAPKVKVNNDTLYNFVDALEQSHNNHAQASVLAHPDGSVTTAKLAEGSVSTSKLADAVVTSQKIATGAVGAGQLSPSLFQNFGDIAVQGKFQDVDAQLADIAYGGQASLYGVEPIGADQTTQLNNYFDTLASKGVRYASFDKAGTYQADNVLTKGYKVLKIGNAKITKKNATNWFTHISKSARNFNGKINSRAIRSSANTDTSGFRRVAEVLKLNQNVKVSFIGDSITTAGREKANLKLRGVRTGANPLGFTNAPDGLDESASYPVKMMDMLMNSFPDNTFVYSNYGIGGTTIDKWDDSTTIDGVTKTKWIDFCKDETPDLLVIGFGMNHVNNDMSKTFSFDLKSLLDYVKANFSPVPDIVVVTSPRCAYVAGEATWGTYTTHSSIHMTANIARAIGMEYGAYVCDVARISDIKRVGLDYTRPILKKIAVTDFVTTLSNVNANPDGSYFFVSGGKMTLNNNYLKDFQIKLKLNFTVNAASTGNAFGVRFNKTNGASFYENQASVYPRFSDNVAHIVTAMRIADYTRYTGYITGTYIDTTAYAGTDVVVTITKRGPIVEVKLGDTESRVIQDYADCFDAPGYLEFVYNTMTTGETVTLKTLDIWEAEYPEYLPVLLDGEMFGNYVANDYTVKQPYGGNGVNHPSSIGIEECYVPAVAEMVEDIKTAVNIRYYLA